MISGEKEMTTHSSVLAWRIPWNAGLEEAQAGIKIAGRNINNLRHADDTTLMADSITDSMDMSLSKLQKTVKDREAWPVAVRGIAKCETQPSN